MKHTKKVIISFLSIISLFAAGLVCPFSVKAAVSGDVTGDGVLSAEDAREILRLSVGIDPMTTEMKLAADVDGDGKVSAEDARQALRMSIGLTENKPRSIKGSKLEGYTKNGYPIETINGLTYIDGVLIANKTYPLPDSYNPGGLLPDCKAAFEIMKKDAAEKGMSIYISSGFRSFSSQKSIYNRYVSRDGKALADTYSARPGHSEHQTGLAIDLNTITQSFGRTKEGKWVAEHCHEYGFILRYPEGKSHITGYCFEPWHLRYVGIETATKIAQSGLCLEEYYGITSFYAE